MFGEGMNGEVRFGEEGEAGDASGEGEGVPEDFADSMEIQFVNERLEEGSQDGEIVEFFGQAAVGFDDPFDTGHKELATVQFSILRSK